MTIEEISVELWPSAAPSRAWRLESDALRATIVAEGAHVVEVQMRSGDGWVPVSVDYPPTADPGGYHGATVGRYANRIAGAAYEFQGRRHQLVANEGRNQLHGGPDGFSARMWDLVDAGEGRIRLRLHSPDDDQGYPGAVDVAASFALAADSLTIRYTAEASEPTALNITSHPYWNLAGSGPPADQHLDIVAEAMVEVDDEGIPVAGPPGPRDPAGDLDAIVQRGGLDNCFVLGPRLGGQPQITLVHAPSGRRLCVETDQPGMQVYTGQHLDPNRRGIAFEAQRLPDGPNRPDFGPSVTETFASTTTFRFDHG